MNTAAMLEDRATASPWPIRARKRSNILRRGEKFDLLITDQGMPGMTGAELIEHGAARSGPTCRSCWRPAMPNCRPAWRPRAAVCKPFMQNQLLQIVKETVKG